MSQENSNDVPRLLGVITTEQHETLLNNGSLPEDAQRVLGSTGVRGEFALVHDEDMTGTIATKKMVDARDGTVVSDATRERLGFDTPATEKARLAKESTSRIQAHERGEDPFALKSPYGGGSR